MLRSERLEPVHGIASNDERRAAEAFVAVESRVTEAERKLGELERYSQEYRATLRERTMRGIDAAQLRAFHGFISRLGEAVTQQALVLERAREERALLRQRWIEASRRTQAVGKVIEHASTEERRDAERREQHDCDERAQRAFAATVLAQRESQAVQPREET